MGRRESPIEDTGPLGEWATQLRQLRYSYSTPPPTYREMADKCHFSHSTLAEAAGGKIFPAWEVAEAYVTVLGAKDELPKWAQFWRETEQTIGNLRRKLGEAGLDLIVPEDGETRGPRQGTRLRGVKADLLEPEQCQPQPHLVRTYDDLRREMEQLKITAGAPSFRELRRWMGKRASASTLNELFTGRRGQPKLDAVLDVVKVLLEHAHGEPPGKAAVDEWRRAWVNAESNRRRVDLDPRGHNRTIWVSTNSQDPGPLAGVIAEMDLGHAVAHLAQLDRAAAAKLIQQLPSDRATAVIKALADLERPVMPTPPSARPAQAAGEGLTLHQGEGGDDQPTPPGPQLKPV